MSSGSWEMFLSKDQVKELTGYQFPRNQIRWLRANGYAHAIARNGRPIVMIAEVEQKLLSSSDHVKGPEPDFSIFHKNLGV